MLLDNFFHTMGKNLTKIEVQSEWMNKTIMKYTGKKNEKKILKMLIKNCINVNRKLSVIKNKKVMQSQIKPTKFVASMKNLQKKCHFKQKFIFCGMP